MVEEEKTSAEEPVEEIHPIREIQEKMAIHAKIVERLFNPDLDIRITIIARSKKEGADPIECIFVTGEDNIKDIVPALKKNNYGLWTPLS